jgi:iron complex transport system ATP-binding protein
MLLELNEVCGGYGNGDIVKGVSCSADHGNVLCLVGPNPATLPAFIKRTLLPTENGCSGLWVDMTMQ